MTAEGYTDDELLVSARGYAFDGMINIVALENKELRNELRGHFAAIMRAIDTERSKTP